MQFIFLQKPGFWQLAQSVQRGDRRRARADARRRHDVRERRGPNADETPSLLQISRVVVCHRGLCDETLKPQILVGIPAATSGVPGSDALRRQVLPARRSNTFTYGKSGTPDATRTHWSASRLLHRNIDGMHSSQTTGCRASDSVARRRPSTRFSSSVASQS